MKKASKILLILLLAGTTGFVSAQTITVGGSPTNLPCGGGNVNLTAVGNSTTPVFGDNFNSGGVTSGWSASAAAQFNNPCGAGSDGTTYLWMGPTTSAPREMTTASVDVSCGGTVCFDFKFVCESCGDSAPCEGADYYNEGVSLQYSVDGGTTWIDFAYFAPNGDLLTNYPGSGVYSPYASGNTPFTTWNNYCFTIPAGAWSPTTMFQLHQWGSSGANYDHWGIDNFYVYANPCAPYYYDWAHIPGSPDAADVTTNVTQSGWYTCCYTNGTNSVCDSVYITVAVLPNATVVTVDESCLGYNDGSATIDNPSGNGPFTIQVTGPISGTYNETNGATAVASLTGLPPGNYSYTTTSATGCQNTGTFVINPGPVCCSVDADSINVLCNGGSTGVANAIPSGGFAPYSYQWDDPALQQTQSASGLTAGTYTVTLTDATGCTDQATVVVLEPTAVSSGNTPTMVTCLNACDGAISVTPASGGTPGYTYNLNGGTFGASTNFTGLCAGNYTVIAQDANGCQFVMAGINITQPTDLTLTQTANTPATCGASNGSFTVAAGGGTPPYNFDIGGSSQGSGTFSGLAAGNYTATVTDANGCTEVVNIVIANSAGPVAFVDLLNDANCFGGSNGSVTIGVTGGTSPYLFSLDAGPNQASNNFTNLTAGSHTVVVTDANGCTGDVTFNISQPTLLQFNTVNTDVTCFGVCDGEIDITANGANPPYTYSDDNGLTFQTSNILTGLCAGNINVVVQDANGCLANSLEVLGSPTAVSSTFAPVDPSCYQTPTGEIGFTPSGGTPGYSYSVDNGVTYSGTSPVTSLMAGTYDVVVMDANGCTYNDQVTLTDPPPFTFTYIANNPSNCGANDGSFEIIASAGMAPYIYSIDGGLNWQVNNGFFLNLYSGLYTLIVQDANGCTDSVYEALSDNVMTTDTMFTAPTTCYNSCDGAAGVVQQFGAPPFTYTDLLTGVVQGSGIFTGLCAGTHYIQIEDDGLCIGIEQVEILEPDSITFTPIGTDLSCPTGTDPGGVDGQISFGAVLGGTGGPYTYSIDGGATYQAGSVFTGLGSGTYVLFAQDANGCLGSTQITLDEPQPFSAVINQTDLTCNGNNTGFVQVVPDGGTPSYSYSMAGVGSNTTGVFAGLAANNYAITITDANGCIFDTSQVVNEPTPLVAAYVVADALCNGSADGSITVNAGGGTPNYVYSSDGGTFLQSSNILMNLAAGNYSVYVEDANGCTVIANQIVGEPTMLDMTIATNPATCGLNNGDLTVTANNGTPGYQYSVDNGVNFQAGNFFAGLAATNYTVVLEDANGCQIDSIISISADILPVIDNIVVSHPLCFGDANGTIDITSSGGVGAHQYSVDGGATFQAGSNFTGLNSGTYTIVVMDANGCQAQSSVDLIDPVLLTYNAVNSDLLCFNDFTGSIVVTANGGTPPYQYSNNNGTTFQGGGTFGFIAAGNYDILVQDANGCQTTGVEVIGQPNPLVVNLILNDPVCYNSCDGSGLAVVGGGTAPYIYNWFGGIGSTTVPEEAENVCPGTYGLMVIDDNGCVLDTSGLVFNNPAPMVINSVTTNDLQCYNDATGEIIIDAPTAVNYSIDGGNTFQVGNTFSGLTIGNYNIVVQDVDGCEAISNTSVYQPDSLYSIAPSNWFGCYGGDVQVQAFTNGGTVDYTYEWTNDVDATVVTSATFPYVNNLVAPGINFTLVVTDANGCVAAPVTFNIQAQQPLQVTASNDTTICIGGTATLAAYASGGELIDFGSYLGYSYLWDTGIPGDTLETVDVSPVVQTQYIVTVSDLCGQVVEDTVVVSQYVDPIPDILGGGNGCIPETMTFDNPSYLPGSTVYWDFGDGGSGQSTGQISHTYDNLGCYDVTVTVTSADGCTTSQTYAQLVCINPLPEPAFTWFPWSPSIMDPTVDITDLSNGGDSWQYTFFNNENGDVFGNVYEQNPSYTFPVEVETEALVCQYVTTSEGCMDSTCQIIIIHEEILFYVPNVFTPDGDPYNQTFKPIFTSGVDPFEYHLTIFNRWGEIVFESYNYDFGWDGTYSNQGLVQDGVYVWQIEFGEKLTDQKQTHRGHVTVLK